MSLETNAGPVVEVLASLLGLTPEEVAGRAAEESFLGLGGNSVSAMDFVAILEEELGLIVDLGHLIGLAPLSKVLAAAVPGGPAPAVGEPVLELSRPVVPEQDGYLRVERFIGGTSMHGVVSGELFGPLDETALLAGLDWLVVRHEGLRTVFEESPDGYRRRVLQAWKPSITRQTLRLPAGADAAGVVHSALVRGSAHLISTFGAPAHAFVLTRFSAEHHLLSLVIHHALADGWAAGLLWKELAAFYQAETAGERVELPSAPGPDHLLERAGRLAPRVEEAARQRAAELEGYPTVVELPSDLARPARFDFAGGRVHFTLGQEAKTAVDAVVARSKVTRSTMLLSAWELVVARRAAVGRFLVGISAAGRTDATSLRLFAPCAALVPIRCDLEGDLTVADHLERTSAAVAEGVSASSVPIGLLTRGLRALADGRRTPLIQIAFSGQDGFLPDELRAGDLRIRLHEAFNGFTAADAALLVLGWGDEPRLAVEYASAVVSATEAAALAEAVEATVLELAAHYDEPLARVRAMSERQRAEAAAFGQADDAASWIPDGSGLWHHLERRMLERWDQPAVHDADRDVELSYGQLMQAVSAQARVLAASGVGEGDLVAVALPRSAEEVVAVLAALRLGAAYLPLDRQSPTERLGRILATAGPAAVIGDEAVLARLDGVLPEGCVCHRPRNPKDEQSAAPLPVPSDDPEKAAYVIFTSGSSGEPKGVVVPHRSVVRLLLDGGIVGFRPGERVLRLGPLGFDISVIELFGALLNGGTLEIFPDELPHPAAMAAFFRTRGIGFAALPPAVFRSLAEHRPDAFAAVRRVLVGGDVVLPEPVCAVLKRSPGLIVSNAYGPTENGVVSTQHVLGDACEVSSPLPIGRPIPGTSVMVVDARGEAVPPGGIGELCCFGAGVAVGYLGDEERTAKAFIEIEGERCYRTGDLVRWDAEGRLRFLGRADSQVKIRGYRVEPGEVHARIAAHPSVADAVVVAVDDDSDSRRLLAAVVLRESLADPLDQLKRFAGEGLPRAMMPELWAIVPEIPLTPNGKHDVRRLEALAVRANPNF